MLFPHSELWSSYVQELGRAHARKVDRQCRIQLNDSRAIFKGVSAKLNFQGEVDD